MNRTDGLAVELLDGLSAGRGEAEEGRRASIIRGRGKDWAGGLGWGHPSPAYMEEEMSGIRYWLPRTFRRFMCAEKA